MSELSATQICSAALVLIGERPISDIEDTGNPNAVRCKAVYAKSRDALLREYAWGFATKRVALAQAATAPVFGYTYQYPLPADCLRVLETQDASIVYELEDGYLLTDEEEIQIRYIARVTQTGKFDSLYTECLSIRIARELAYAVVKKLSMVQAMDELLKRAMPAARQIDANEGNRAAPTPESQSSWLAARL